MLQPAHAALAIELTAYDWDWPNAEKEFRRAIELNPDYPTSHANYGWYLSLMARTEEAIAESTRATELDPLSTVYNHNLGLAFYRGRRPDQAVAQFQKTLDLDPYLPEPEFCETAGALALAFASPSKPPHRKTQRGLLHGESPRPLSHPLTRFRV